MGMKQLLFGKDDKYASINGAQGYAFNLFISSTFLALTLPCPSSGRLAC